MIDSRPPATVAPTATEDIAFHATGSASGYECRLGSAAFEPCSSPWAFEVGEPGEHSGEIRAVGVGGVDPTPATFAFRSAAPVERCGTLAHDETWSTHDISGVVLTCAVEIPSGVTLTIEPGVFVKSLGGGMNVHGTLDAEGTAAEPTTFTSWADDSVGGTLAGDNSGSPPANPAPGDWGGIYAESGSTVDLEHAAVDYAYDGLEDNSQGATVAASSFDHEAYSAIRVSSGLGLDGLMGSGNSAAGDGQVDGIEVGCGQLGQDSTITTRADWQFELVGPGCNYYEVPAGKKLVVSPGSVVKLDHAAIVVHGTLDAEGTAAEPTTFTSWADDSVGGTLAGDNSGSPPANPAPGDWGGTYAESGSTVDLEHATLRYASTALRANEGAEATVHGAILDSEVGVSGSEGFVDATEVNWGDPSGPSPIGAGTPYEGGGVLVTPWIGYVAPVIPVDPNPYVPPASYHCADVAFIGARGSGEDPQGDPPAFSGPEDGLGSRVGGAYSGFLDRLEQFGSSPNVKVLGVHYRALGTVFNPLKFGTQAYFESIYEGVDQLQEMILDEESACPGEKLVLAGYSQGALVIHIALLDLASSDPAALRSSHLAAVLLIADPAKVGHGAEELWEADLELAGGGVQNADGIWTKVPGLPDEDKGPIPSSVVGSEPGRV